MFSKPRLMIRLKKRKQLNNCQKFTVKKFTVKYILINIILRRAPFRALFSVIDFDNLIVL